MALGQASQLMAFKHTFEAREAAESSVGALEPPLEEVAPMDAEAPAEDTEQNRLLLANTIRHLTNTMALGYISAIAVLAEYSGKNQFLPEPAEAIATSMAHPVLGYAGAWVGSIAARNKSSGVRVAAVLATATAANFVTEKAQSVIVASPQFVHFLSEQNLPETGKDYLAALIGAGLFALQNRQKSS